MNETISLPRLIALVAERANVQPAEARKFIHELFAAVESALLENENVKIKGIGEFVKGEDAASPVVLKVDDELAAIVNEPFAAFDAVELNEGAAEEILKIEKREPTVTASACEEKVDAEPISETVDEGPEKGLDKESDKEKEEEKPDIEAPVDIEEKKEEKNYAEEVVEPSNDIESESESEPEPEPEPEEPQMQDDDTTDIHKRVVYVQQPANHGMWLMLGVLIGLIAGLVGGYFAGKYMARYELPAEEDMVFDEDTLSVASIFNNPVDTIIPAVQPDTTPIAESQALQPANAAPAPAQQQPVYDTVSSRRYLAIIAGEHYGVKNYWIFIYNANPDLGDPNKIAPGTRVLIPAKESFMEATKTETDAKARRLLNELSKKYKL